MKRNLEGNSGVPILFSEMSDKAMLHISTKNFSSFNMLRELEIARDNLHSRKLKANCETLTEDITEEGNVNERFIEWLQDDLSESESIILAQSKKGGNYLEGS